MADAAPLPHAPSLKAPALTASAAPALTAKDAGLIGCRVCGLVSPAGAGACRRCGTALHSREPHSLQRVWAWWTVGLICYVPANILPMMITSTAGKTYRSNILGGVIDLVHHGAFAIAAIVFLASIVIPVSKFMVVALLAWSMKHPTRIPVHARIHLYHAVEFIGRWSMVDVFVVAILAALVQMGFFASIDPGPAAVFFALSVAFTMISAQAMDPRLIWDSARPPGAIMADFHDPVIETPKSEPSSRRISAVWLIPLIALAISLTVAWRSYNDRGPTIEIVLDSAAGVTAGATTLRYRDVQFGVVEKLGFTPDLQKVVLTARVDKDMARYLDDSAQFWVVRPSVTAQGVTGIETVLSGVYIEAQWSGQAGARVERFTALPRAPLTPAGTAGRRVTLRAPDGGSLAVGAPVLFKKIAVGRVESVELQPTGEIQVALFVNAPYDAFLTEGVRFWNASGFSIQLGAGGASLNVESLISLLQGGVSFAQVDADATPAPDGRVFDLFASESAARQNAVETLPGARVSLDIFLHGSVAGLQPGAPVIFRGVTVGDVAALEPIVEGEGHQRRLSMRATLSIAQQRLGLPAEASTDQALALLQDLVGQGLRARLASAGLLSQTLQVELSEMPDAPPASMNLEALPHPILPSAPADSSGLSASAEGLMNRLSSLPIEELMTTVTTLVGNVNALVTSPEVRSAPENVGALIADIREVVETSGIKDTPAQIAATLASIQSVVSDLETRKVMASLADTLETTRVTIEKFGVVADGVPRLVDETATLADRVNALPLDEFIASATRTVDGIDALVRSEGAASLPGSVDATLAEARGLIADLRQGGAIENASATLASLKELTDQLKAADLGAQISRATAAAERATVNVDAATKGLPELMENLRALSARVNELPLDQLVTSADTVLRSADALLGAEGMDRVPTELAASLAEVRAMVTELREGGAVANLNSALASADEAAAAITAASANLPQLIASINAATARADLALSTFEPGSQINRETQNLLRDLRTAAQSVNALVTALERKPNSVLFGR